MDRVLNSTCIDDLYNLKLDQKIGKGAYGTVVAATDKRTGIPVAVKMSRQLDDDTTCLRTLREIELLQHFCGHRNIVSIIDVFYEASSVQVYIVLERIETSLEYVLHDVKRGYLNPLQDDQTRHILWQILCGLQAIHGADVVHRDLKPANILINRTSLDTKICDFGLARAMSPRMSIRVATRWYRAPEVLLNPGAYTKAADIWAAGCILAEMLLDGEPLFPAKDSGDLLNCIFDILGIPPGLDLTAMPLVWSLKHAYNRSMRPKRSWDDLYKGSSPEAVNLLARMILFNPGTRIDATTALAHEYIGYSSDRDFVFPPASKERSWGSRRLLLAEIKRLARQNVEPA